MVLFAMIDMDAGNLIFSNEIIHYPAYGFFSNTLTLKSHIYHQRINVSADTVLIQPAANHANIFIVALNGE